MKFTKSVASVTAAAALAALAPAAQAALALRLSDGVTTVTIMDGGFGDMNSAAGAITFIGGIGAFDINVSTALGDARTAFMGIHMDSLNNSLGAGTLLVAMSETSLNFGAAGPTGVTTRFGGISEGTIQGRMFVDDANVLFSESTQVFDSGVLGSGAFSRAGWGETALTDPFSMTMLVSITHGPNGGTSSFNFDAKVPEPGTLALLGAALLGLGATARKRTKV
jgi:hypothetical protein